MLPIYIYILLANLYSIDLKLKVFGLRGQFDNSFYASRV